MDIKRCTIDSQDILRHENARAFFVCLLSFVLSLLILGAALFGVYSLYTVSGLDKEKIQRSRSLFTICPFCVGGYRFSVCSVRRFLQPQKMVLPQRLGKSTCIISFCR